MSRSGIASADEFLVSLLVTITASLNLNLKQFSGSCEAVIGHGPAKQLLMSAKVR